MTIVDLLALTGASNLLLALFDCKRPMTYDEVLADGAGYAYHYAPDLWGLA
jgi:hypothetical protein